MAGEQLDCVLAERARDIIAVIEEQGDFRTYRLAIEWPSLAAALGELMDAAGVEVVPIALRRAMVALREGAKVAQGPVVLDGSYTMLGERTAGRSPE